MSKKRKENEEESASIKDWIISILIAVGIAIVIKMFFFDFVVVQGPSMQPTLHQGQRPLFPHY